MTTFFADLRVYRNPDHHYWTLSIEVGANDLHHALSLIQAWTAGLAVHERIDTSIEESIYTSKRRGANYLTFREAANELRPFLDGR